MGSNRELLARASITVDDQVDKVSKMLDSFTPS